MIPHFYMCAGARCTGGSTGLPPWWLLVLLSVFVCGADFGNANNTGFQLHGNAFYLGWDLPYWDPIGFTNLRSADKTAHPISRVSNRLQHIHGNSIAMFNTGMHIILTSSWSVMASPMICHDAQWHCHGSPWYRHSLRWLCNGIYLMGSDELSWCFTALPWGCHAYPSKYHGSGFTTCFFHVMSWKNRLALPWYYMILAQGIAYEKTDRCRFHGSIGRPVWIPPLV